MKSLSKIAVTSGITTVAVAAFGMAPVLAGSPGQLEGGPIYQVKNLTQKGAYGITANAAACDELEYSIKLHNTEFGALSGIAVNVNLPTTSATSNVSTATATTASGGTTGTNGSVTVNLSSAQSIGYENGTTKLFDGQGNVVQTLPDTIAQSGVNVGNLNGSTIEFVNFKAKVNCPPVTPPTTPTTPTTPVTPAAPTKLVNTGPGSVAALFVVAVLAGTIGYRSFLSRRLSK